MQAIKNGLSFVPLQAVNGIFVVTIWLVARAGRADQQTFGSKAAYAVQIGMNAKHLPQNGTLGGSALGFAVVKEELPLTVRDAAVYLGVSVQTVYLWVERKQIPHLRVMGRNIRFLKSDLETFRAAFRQEATHGASQVLP